MLLRLAGGGRGIMRVGTPVFPAGSAATEATIGAQAGHTEGANKALAWGLWGSDLSSGMAPRTLTPRTEAMAGLTGIRRTLVEQGGRVVGGAAATEPTTVAAGVLGSTVVAAVQTASMLAQGALLAVALPQAALGGRLMSTLRGEYRRPIFRSYRAAGPKPVALMAGRCFFPQLALR